MSASTLMPAGIGLCSSLSERRLTLSWMLYLGCACCVKSSVPIEVMFQELSVTRCYDFGWRTALRFWNAIFTSMIQADSAMSSKNVPHDAIALAQQKLLSGRMGTALVGLHRCSDTLLSMASLAHS